MQLHPDLNPRGRNGGPAHLKPLPHWKPLPLASEVSLLSPFCFHPPSHPPSYGGRKEVGERAGHWARSRVSGGLSHLRLRPAPHHLRALGDRGRGALLGHPAPRTAGGGSGLSHVWGWGSPPRGQTVQLPGSPAATEPQSASGTFCLLSGAPRPGGTRGLPSPPEEVPGTTGLRPRKNGSAPLSAGRLWRGGVKDASRGPRGMTATAQRRRLSAPRAEMAAPGEEPGLRSTRGE